MNASGRPIDPGTATDWTLCGFDLEKVRRRSDGDLQLDGVRVAVRSNPDQRIFERHLLKVETMRIVFPAPNAPGVEPALAAMFSIGIEHGPSHFWSLAVEEQFYFIWPFLILFWPRSSLASAMWGTVAMSTGLRIVLLHTSVSLFYLTFTRLDGLAAGGLLALYYFRGWLARYRVALGVGAVLSFAVMVVGAMLSKGHGLVS